MSRAGSMGVLLFAKLIHDDKDGEPELTGVEYEAHLVLDDTDHAMVCIHPDEEHALVVVFPMAAFEALAEANPPATAPRRRKQDFLN